MKNTCAQPTGARCHEARPERAQRSEPLDINQHGTVIGESLGWILFAGEYEMVLPRAFVWTRRTGMMALDDLIPAGWIISHVIAINDHEEILATASYLNDAHTVVLEPVNGRLK